MTGKLPRGRRWPSVPRPWRCCRIPDDSPGGATRNAEPHVEHLGKSGPRIVGFNEQVRNCEPPDANCIYEPGCRDHSLSHKSPRTAAHSKSYVQDGPSSLSSRTTRSLLTPLLQNEPEPEAEIDDSHDFSWLVSDPQNGSRFSSYGLNKLNDLLTIGTCGDDKFFSCDLKQVWLSVDIEDLKLNRESVMKKFFKNLRKCIVARMCGLISFPVLLAIGVPFTIYVKLFTRQTDWVRWRTERMMCRILLMSFFHSAGWIAIFVLINLFADSPYLRPFTQLFLRGKMTTCEMQRRFRQMIDPKNGTLTEYECFAPLGALFILLVMDVIQKQSRDMTYLVNHIRHHIVVDESFKVIPVNLYTGPVSHSDLERDSSRSWLFQEIEEKDGFSWSRIKVYFDDVCNTLVQLRQHTGAVSELAETAKDMFDHGGMEDVLEQRADILQSVAADLYPGAPGDFRIFPRDGIVSLQDIRFNVLLELVCAGYSKHFCHEVKPDVFDYISSVSSEDPRARRDRMIANLAGFVYGLIPTVILVHQDPGSFWRRLPHRFGAPEDYQVDSLMAFTAFFTQVCMVSSMIRFLLQNARFLRRSYESLIILQRIASTHHQRCANQESEEDSEALDRSARQFRWRQHSERCFSSRVPRGADCHINVEHKHRFDKILEKFYISPQTSDLKDRGEHYRSFVELDLHDKDHLQLWWALRKFVETGILHQKVSTELTLMCATTGLAALVATYLLSIWQDKTLFGTVHHISSLAHFVLIGLSLHNLLGICARLNSILQSDGDRLTFIHNDIVSQMHSSSAQHSEQREASLELLKTFQEHIDRDFHPVQVFGVTITERGWLATRIWFVVCLVSSIVRYSTTLFFDLNSPSN